MSARQPELEDCEQLLTDPEELYLRQVSEKRVDRGEVMPQAFETASNDAGKLSGARSSKQSAEGAWRERETTRPGASAGTWAISVGEVAAAGSRIVDDSDCPPPPDLAEWPTGHSYLDFRGLDKDQRKQLRIAMAEAATDRGCAFHARP